MKIIALICLGIFLPGIVYARCLLGDDILKSQGMQQALPYYESCSLQHNDDASHMVLAHLYQTGAPGIPVNVQKTLLFYHLAADNGNATAQRQLAQLLLKLDETPSGREEIKRYLSKVQTALKQDDRGAFKGELMHPYTLLLLAAEKPDQKWYYPASELSDPVAASVLQKYQISDEKKKAALKDATAWKNKKMLEMAKKVFSDADYSVFFSKLYPRQGRSDAYTRSQALASFKEKVEQFRMNNK
ncbi:MAG: hypothetical protein LBU87_00880 [Lactobacillales bacterium]|jgi:TPR repeat protein|nr:hypothetical protein [Lactobacillales bacterium]